MALLDAPERRTGATTIIKKRPHPKGASDAIARAIPESRFEGLPKEKEHIIVFPSLSEEDPEKPLRNTPEVRAVLRMYRDQARKVFAMETDERLAFLQFERDALKKKRPCTVGDLRRIRDIGKEIERLSCTYTGIKQIGKGGYGSVYFARDTHSREPLVLKIISGIDAEHFERLVRESEILLQLGQKEGMIKGFFLKKLGTEGVPGIPDSGGKFLLEMEHVEGMSLKKFGDTMQEYLAIFDHSFSDEAEESFRELRFQKSQFQPMVDLLRNASVPLRALKTLSLPDSKKTFFDLNDTEDMSFFDAQQIFSTLKKIFERAVIEITIKVCQGFQTAHEAGVIHRDIKPANIMLEKSGNVKVIDWGLGKRSGESQREMRSGTSSSAHRIQFKDILETNDAIIIGTPSYMSPEDVSRSEGTGETTSDIWALGITLTELLSGGRPFEKPHEKKLSALDVMIRVKEYEMVNLEALRGNIDPRLWDIILKALAKEPRDRYQSMTAFQADLQDYLDLTREG